MYIYTHKEMTVKTVHSLPFIFFQNFSNCKILTPIIIIFLKRVRIFKSKLKNSSLASLINISQTMKKLQWDLTFPDPIHIWIYSLCGWNIQEKQNGKIGIVLQAAWYEPISNSTADKMASERARAFDVNWYSYPSIMIPICSFIPTTKQSWPFHSTNTSS